MGKNNTPFNRDVFTIAALDTVDVTSVVDNFKFLTVPIRYNELTATNFRTTSLPDNELDYEPAYGGIMKVFDLANRNDLDKYFVADTSKALYSSLNALINYAASPVSVKIFLLDLEDEVLTADIPKATQILKYIHKADTEALPYQKIERAKEQIHTKGYMIKGMPLLGIGEIVDPDLASSISPDLLSLDLLDKLNEDASVVPSDLLPSDKAAILKSSVNINYNIQNDEELIFDILLDGDIFSLENMGEGEEFLIESSTVELKYKKSNLQDVTAIIPAMDIDIADVSKCRLIAPLTRLIDFDQTRVTSVKFLDSTVPAKYTLTIESAPTSTEYTENFAVKQTFDSTVVKVIVASNTTTLLNSEDEILSISLDASPDLQAKFNFKFTEKAQTPISSDALKYLYVKVAEIKIASLFKSDINECQTIIDVAADAIIGGPVFSYGVELSENLYMRLKALADSYPISFARDYHADTLVNKVVDLTSDDTYSISFAALGKFYSLKGTDINYDYDIYAHDLTFSDSFKAKLKLPTLYYDNVKLPYGNLMQVVPVETDGVLHYYCDNAKSMVTTSGIYNYPKDLFIKAYSYYQINVNITKTIVIDIKNDNYSVSMVEFFNDALDRAASNIITTFGSNIELDVTKLNYTSQQPNQYLVTSTEGGIRNTTLNLGKVATLVIKGLVDAYEISYERQIKG